MKKYILTALALLFTFNLSVYGQDLQEYIGTPDRSEVILDTKGLTDGGSVMVGYSTVLNAANQYDYTTTDILIMRVDNNGNVMWNRRFGVPNTEDFLKSVIICQDGHIAAAGYVNHVPWMLTSATPSYASIFRFDINTGATIASNFIDAPSGYEDDKGSIYESLIQLDNGDYVAVGSRDSRPSFSDGMVTYFDGALNLVWNRVHTIYNTDALQAVTQVNNRIFVGGGYYGSSYYDIYVTEYTASGAVVWSKQYPYTFTNPNTGVAFTNNIIEEMKVVNNELMILTSSLNDFGATAGWMTGVLRTDLVGNVQSLIAFNQNTFNYSNLASIDYESSTNAYYVINPGSTVMNLHAPGPSPLVVADALLGIIDPSNGGVSSTRSLLHTGNQSLLSLNISGANTFYGGTSEDDPTQIGALDVYYVRSTGGLPDDMQDCPVEIPELDEDNAPYQEMDFNYSNPELNNEYDVELMEHEEVLEVILLCIEEPCNIEDITFCGSYANPLTYTFNVVTDPPGSSVEWDFGDGSPIVSSTAGTPVVHTYASGGSYTVCVSIVDPVTSDPCDTKCIEICVNNGGVVAAKSGANKQQNTSVTIKESNTVIGELYPNPTDGALYIPVTTKQNSSEVDVRVLRMDGVVVHTSKSQIEKGKQVLKIDLNNLPPGNYMCEVRDGDIRSVKLFTKN